MKKFGYVMAPKVLVSNKLKVRFLYREKPDNINDSGWRLFSGDEDQEYVDNPNNIAIYDVKSILAFDRDIEKLLAFPVGSAFEREDSNQKFAPAVSFNFSDVE